MEAIPYAHCSQGLVKSDELMVERQGMTPVQSQSLLQEGERVEGGHDHWTH